MCKTNLHNLLVALPKCEHHMHIEGSLSPELLFQLATRNNVKLPVAEDAAFSSVESLYKRYDAFSSLDDFLHYYYIGMSVLLSAADFETLAFAYFERVHAANLRHAEIFFDPQAHLVRGIALADVVRGLRAAARRAEQQWGLTSLIIPCLLRHLPVDDSGRVVTMLREGGYWGEAPAATAQQIQAQATELEHALEAEELKGSLGGLGLCSSEKDKPPMLWSEVFAAAVAKNAAETNNASTHARRITAHAGEEGPAEYIIQALDHLGAQRIDHGVAAASDPAVMARLARDQILLTVCPLSNVCLRVTTSVAEVPIRTFLDNNVPFSINSDDPAYFGGYIMENYCAVQEAHNLAPADWVTITRNSVRGSWCSDARKAELLGEIDSVMAKWEAGQLA